MREKIIGIMFCLMLAAGVLAGVLVPDKYYSDHEKRTLTRAPELSGESVLEGDFQDELEEYLADQFPLRDEWVTLKTLGDLATGRRESGGVYFAEDGYLIEAVKSLDMEQAALNLGYIKTLSDTLEASGVKLEFMPVPTACRILSEKLPAYAAAADQTQIIDMALKLGINTVDVSAALEEHKDEYIYYRTDHHWTSLGAWYGYEAWRNGTGSEDGRGSALGLEDYTAETLCTDFRGTTYNKVNYSLAAYDEITAYYTEPERRVDYNGGYYVTDSIYERSYLEGSDKYGVFLNSNQETTVIEGDGDASEKLLIIKDSYANCFAQFAPADYGQVHLIDLRFFRDSVAEYAAEQGITEVLVLYNIPNFCDSDLKRLR